MRRLSRFRIFLVIIGIVTLYNCTSKKEIGVTNETNNYIYYPLPPDTARIQFLKSISTSNDLNGKKASPFIEFLTGEKDIEFGISKPYGVTTSEGKIYVADMNGAVVNIDLEKKDMELFIPEGLGQLVSPVNCNVDNEGNLYVADLRLGKVMIYNPYGEFIGEISKDKEFAPSSVFITDEKIWVCNKEAKKIEVYTNDALRKYLYSFPNVEKGDDGFLYTPINIWVTNDKVYVSDTGGFKINIYNHDGDYLGSIGTQGTSFGQFSMIKGVAVDKEGNVFAVDSKFENVQIFNSKGQLLLPFARNRERGNIVAPAGIAIDYKNTQYFIEYVDPKYDLKYLILVTGMYGANKLNVYGRIEMKK